MMTCAVCGGEIRSRYLLYTDDRRVCELCALASGLAVADIRPAGHAGDGRVACMRGRYTRPEARAAALRDLLSKHAAALARFDALAAALAQRPLPPGLPARDDGGADFAAIRSALIDTDTFGVFREE